MGAFLVSWAAESASMIISQGLALAILSWIQMLPELSVEATVAYTASYESEKISMIASNFTGSIRMLAGLAIPLIFLVRAFLLKHYTKVFQYKLPLLKLHSISILGNLIPVMIFFVVLLRKRIYLIDAVILITVYLLYLWFLRKTPPMEESIEEAGFIPQQISKIKPLTVRYTIILLLLISSGIIFYKFTPPFINISERTALKIGLSSFLFLQYLAPFLTEFEEMLTIFYWAKGENKAPVGLLNLLNANISQWTLLPAVIPIAFFLGGGETYITLTSTQCSEIALTMSQTLLLIVILLKNYVTFFDTFLLLFMWLGQFVFVDFRNIFTLAYLILAIGMIVIRVVKKAKTEVMNDILALIRS